MGLIFSLVFLVFITISIVFIRARWSHRSNRDRHIAVPSWVDLAAWLIPIVAVVSLLTILYPKGGQLHQLNENDLRTLFALSILLGLLPIFVFQIHDLLLLLFNHFNDEA